MEVSTEEVLKQRKIAEVCMCYTGDILDTKRDKYSLQYYIDMAKEIEKMGAHILGIKDMSALLKPYAAYKLVSALKSEIGIPIHLHTHDTTGNGVATVLMAAHAGVDIVDTAFNSMSGLTSQPALNSVVAALENTERETGLKLDEIQKLSEYWSAVRPVYKKFESGLKTGSAEIYKFEIPGGQYSNLKPQIESFGLGHRFDEIKDMYRKVNIMLGDIVKVTPSSKVVGDLAIFMVKNDLTPENIYDKAANLTFPDSAVSYFKGMMGQPKDGFPDKLQKLILKGEKPIQGRPGELLPPEDFDKINKYLTEKYKIKFSNKDIISYALYPEVFEDYLRFINQYGDLSNMGSDVFFHGLREGEISEIKIAEGKVLIVKMLEIRKADKYGNRIVVYEVNGNRREVSIKDNAANTKESNSEEMVTMADKENINEIGASIPGKLVKLLVKEGDTVKTAQSLAVIEAMKMETNITAPVCGIVKKIYSDEGKQVTSGELLIELE